MPSANSSVTALSIRIGRSSSSRSFSNFQRPTVKVDTVCERMVVKLNPLRQVSTGMIHNLADANRRCNIVSMVGFFVVHFGSIVSITRGTTISSSITSTTLITDTGVACRCPSRFGKAIGFSAGIDLSVCERYTAVDNLAVWCASSNNGAKPW